MPENKEGNCYFSLTSSIQIPSVQRSELRAACIDNDVAAVEALIKGGISVNQQLRDEWTALMTALQCAQPDTVRFLVDAGANMRYQCQSSLFTPLMALATTKCSSNDDICKCLLIVDEENVKRPLNLDATNNRNETALIIATINNHIQIVTWLTSHGASNAFYNKDCFSALGIAASFGHGQMCAVIIRNSKNINLNDLNNEGLTVSEIAKRSGNSKIAAMLYEIQNSDLQPTKCQLILEELEHCFEEKLETSSTKTDIFRNEEATILNHLGLCGLGKYVRLFEQRKIDFERLLTLNHAKLIEMGVKELGARLTILEIVYSANSQEWTAKSLPRLHEDFVSRKFNYGRNKYSYAPISDPDRFVYRNANVIAYQNNIIRQFDIISASLVQMKNEMHNFVSDLTVIRSKSKISVMKHHLLKLQDYVKTVRATETKTRKLLKSFPGRYVDGRYVYNDEILAVDLAKGNAAKRRQLLMYVFIVVSYFVLPTAK